MAGAKPGVHALQLEPLTVHEELKAGAKFIKYEEDAPCNATPGTLKVDPGGFYLIWTAAASTEHEVIDISTIRDTRIGIYAKQPKDPTKVSFSKDGKLFLLTVVYGQDLVNVSFWCFSAMKEQDAQLWAHHLYTMATNILAVNGSRNSFLRKAYTRLQLYANADGKIPVKCFQKMFSDKKKVEISLEPFVCNNKSEGVKADDFTWEAFLKFIDNLSPRTEIQSILEDCGAKRKPFISLDQFTEFINTTQRDSRLNEVLYPPLKKDQVKAIMENYETTFQLDREQISVQAFSRYLGGEENGIIPPERLDIIDEMSHPLAHYFINSSHNTYLTVGQLTGLSSVEMYRQVLLTGCRCIELDCWKGRFPDEEPYITHGFTMTTEISFKEVLEAIAESAFKASPYPLILSFENHVDSPKQQAKMAEYCRTIFGDALLTEPLEKHPLRPGEPLPSPQDLMGKILIKNKKKQEKQDTPGRGTIRRKEADEKSPTTPGGEGESEEDEVPETQAKKPTSDEGTASTEALATEEMSNLVNYIQPVKFKSFEDSAANNKFYEMSSFVETKGMEALKNNPIEFVEYNKNQMSRIYPKGSRVDSSNYMPQIFWNAGCQMVALNFQTLDLAMQLNMGIFEYNGHCGYLLKPEFMRRADKHFDPFTESIVDGIVANTLKIRIISGQFLSDKKVGVYVEVDIFGLPADTKRKFRTKTSNGNSLDPVWDDEQFTFYKLILPTLASLRIAVYDENNKFIGHRILPVSAIRPGFHYINLRNELNQPLLLPSLLVYTEPKDYVPDEHIEYAEALTNPIKHVSQMSKREKQLACFIDEEQENEDNSKETEVNPTDSQPSPFHLNRFLDDLPEIPRAPAPVHVVKEDLVTTVLTDITPLGLDVFLNSKNYTKLKKKQEKELHELQKKIRKKIQSESQKKRTVIDKNFKRSIKKSDSRDKLQEDLEKLKIQLLEEEKRELLMLRQEFHKQEKLLQEKHQTEASEMLKQLVADHHNSELKKYKDLCDKEKKELQKMLERKRINSIGEAKAKLGQDMETTEINRKHINDSVESFRRLEKAQNLRQEKLPLRHQEALQQLEAHILQEKSKLEEKLEKEWNRLPNEICELLQLDPQSSAVLNNSSFSPSSNHSSPGLGTPSNCSTPYSQSTPSRGSIRGSSEKSLLDKSTSPSSSTPVLSKMKFSFS